MPRWPQWLTVALRRWLASCCDGLMAGDAEAHLLPNPLKPSSPREAEAFELLARMVASRLLEMQAAGPCDQQRSPVEVAKTATAMIMLY